MRKKTKSQQLLFPENLEVEKSEKMYWIELIPALTDLGFVLKLENDHLIIEAVPVELKDKNPQRVLTDFMDQHRNNNLKEADLKSGIVAGMASAIAIKGGTRLNTDEMKHLVDELFASSAPSVSPKGKK